MIIRRAILGTLALGIAASGLLAAAPMRAPADTASAHDFVLPGIAGGEVAMADYAGRPVLVVNTASRCGFTNQYEGLQTLWQRYRDRGLVVLGVPSDDFNQELTSEAEVKAFCEANYAIDFPMTAITGVTGRNAHPFYAWLAGQSGAPRWNFHKYLIGPDGRVVESFSTGTGPTAPRVTAAVERLLAGS